MWPHLQVSSIYSPFFFQLPIFNFNNVFSSHLYQVVYEFFLRFIVSSEVNGKVAKRYVDQSFIRSWIELFDAEDPREREYVKTVLHRMYGKFMSYRSSIRKVISQVFFRYIYETGRFEKTCKIAKILF